MEPRGLRVASESAGCAQGLLRRRGFPQSGGPRLHGHHPASPVGRIYLWWEEETRECSSGFSGRASEGERERFSNVLK